jgi:Dyp-type peroxidase family
MTALPLDQIQGFVLRGYSHPRARHFMIHVPAAANGKAFVAAITPMITTATIWSEKPPVCLNVGFTADGLQTLGIDVAKANLSAEFVEGAIQRGFKYTGDDYDLGDTDDSAPNHWILDLGSGGVHVILSLYALDPNARDTATAAILQIVRDAGVKVLGTHDSDDVLGDSRVHFGHHDGISQPNIAGGTAKSDNQPVVATGEFVLGYPAEANVPRPGPAFDPQNGSYSAFRILKQDVDEFFTFLAKAAAQYGLPQEVVQAKFCGRWADGTPLVVSPDHPADNPTNDFDYSGDFPARQCPIASHIRRSQRRNEDTQQHRILRRAFPYGPPYVPQDGQERGLNGHFICTSLQQQYEFVISQWVNGTTVDARSRDALIGAVDAQHPPAFNLYWKDQKTKVEGFGRFTTTRGGAYCYLPSIAGLQSLAH